MHTEQVGENLEGRGHCCHSHSTEGETEAHQCLSPDSGPHRVPPLHHCT